MYELYGYNIIIREAMVRVNINEKREKPRILMNMDPGLFFIK